MKRQHVGRPETKTIKKKRKYFSEQKLKEVSKIFLSDKKHANILIDVLDQFQKPSETPAGCVNAVENIFVEVLKRGDMTLHNLENISETERIYREWLSGCYEDVWTKLTLCLKNGTAECKLQSLNSLFRLLSIEAKFPLVKQKKKKSLKSNFPVHRLKSILITLSSSSNLDEGVMKRMSEYLNYRDVQHNIWLALNALFKESSNTQPDDNSIWNILLVLTKLPKPKKESDICLCDIKTGIPPTRVVKSSVESVWKKLASWQFTSRTNQLLLVVLVEHMMPRMDNTIFLTDYFMDALDRDECEISMIALQGIYNLIITHNIEYPDIFGKLYQLFTAEALNARYKTRLFALADEFLRSTHLPLALVAAFAKRFSRLLLLASPPDMLILLTSIANLLIRHPDLRTLYHNPNGKAVAEDPYLEDEKDPVKSGAIQSQLWEVKLMQHHHSNRVAKTAAFINNDLPSVEHDLEPLLELTWDQMIKKDVKLLAKKIPQVAEKFQDKPLSNKMEEARQKETKLLFADFNKLFVS